MFRASFSLLLALNVVSTLHNSDTMSAMASGSASSVPATTSILDLLVAQESEDARLELVRKHDTLKARMDILKEQRQAQAKQKKALTKAIKAAARAKSRIVAKATTLSKDDLVAILCHKSAQESRKLKKLNTKSSSAEPTAEVDDAPADDEMQEPAA